ncbi:acetyltransferase [Escherichia coli]|nr:acetyltransferase [Escherichia coli]
MVISIRRSRHEEGGTRCDLVSICRCHPRFLSAEYRVELEELVRSFLPEAPLWVAVNERDRPVGFMLLSGQHMDALFIDPDVRGCGVGRMLVEHALSMAPELTTNVNEQNKQAVGFYKKMGFKVTGRSEVDDLGKPYPLLNLAYVGNKLPLPCLPRLEKTRQRRIRHFFTSAKGHPSGWPSAG